MTSLLQPVLDRLKDWVAQVQGDAQWSLSLPAANAAGKAGQMQVATYLLEVARTPVARSEHPAPLQMSLRFLVLACSTDAAGANDLLLRLAFSAMEQPNWEVETDPVPLQGWQALGIGPRPSFVLRMPLRMERPRPVFKRVHSTKVESRVFANLQGVVLGPNDIPVTGAKVEVPSQQRWTETDQRGGFILPGVTLSPADSLRIRARGKQMEVVADGLAGSAQPLTIRFNSLED